MAETGNPNRGESVRFVSYAQNFEDVMLWRALRDVDRGFYVDVGAHDPITYSVTKAFYEHGWRGINIEPVRHYFELLVNDRPEDINLPIASGDRMETKKFFEIPNSGLSTFSLETASRHADQGWEVIERNIQVVPLSDVLREHSTHSIHFLKIDVEGAESMVLKGLDLKLHRPWILVIEATLPMTQELFFEEWEPILLNNGYNFVYFDGLNRFYLAVEHQQLSGRFNTPPNIFDEFQTYSEQQLTSLQKAHDAQGVILRKAQIAYDSMRESFNVKLTALQQQLDKSEAGRRFFFGEAETLRNRLAEESRVVSELHGKLEMLCRSRSWRMTAPIRGIFQVFRTDFSPISNGFSRLAILPVQVAKKMLHYCMARLRHLYLMRRTADFLRTRYPKIWNKLRHIFFYLVREMGESAPAGVRQISNGKYLIVESKKDEKVANILIALQKEIAEQKIIDRIP